MARQQFKPGRPYVKLNHPAIGDIISNPTHVAGYGTGFEGSIDVAIYDDGGKEVGRQSFTQKSGGMGEVGEFYGEVPLSETPDQQTGVVQAWSSSGRSAEDKPNLVSIPIVFDEDVVP